MVARIITEQTYGTLRGARDYIEVAIHAENSVTMLLSSFK